MCVVLQQRPIKCVWSCMICYFSLPLTLNGEGHGQRSGSKEGKATLPLIRFFARFFLSAEFATVSEAALLQETRPQVNALPPSFLAYLSPVTMSPQDFRVQGQPKVSHAAGCLKSRTLQEISHVFCPPIAGPLCLGPTME